MIEIGLLSIAVLAVILAAAMSAVAWRLHRGERDRSEARVAVLAADIHSTDTPRQPVVVGIRRASPRTQPMAARKFVDIESVDLRPARADSSPELFRFQPSGRSGSRLAPVLGLGILAVVSALALIFATGRTGRPAAGSSEPATPAAARSVPASSGAAPLELVALGQDRDEDQITVRGVVRNPSGRGLDHLSAVVLLFNRRGDFIGTGRAPIDPPTLASGSQAAFSVTVANARDVSRYRIRFHRDDLVVPHVDRRSRGPATNTN